MSLKKTLGQLSASFLSDQVWLSQEVSLKICNYFESPPIPRDSSGVSYMQMNYATLKFDFRNSMA